MSATSASVLTIPENQPPRDPLFFVLPWKLNAAYKHVAIIVAIEAGPDNETVVATNKWMAERTRRAEMTIINARHSMTTLDYVFTQPDGYDPNQKPGLRPAQRYAYVLQNVHHVSAPGLKCDRAFIHRIRSWGLPPDLELVMLILAIRRDWTGSGDSVEIAMDQLAHDVGVGTTTVRGYVRELEGLRRINVHQQEREPGNKQRERNRYELPPDESDFVSGHGTRLWSSAPPEEARDREGERLLLEHIRTVEPDADGWRHVSHADGAKATGRHRTQISTFLRRLQRDGELEFKLGKWRLTWIRLHDHGSVAPTIRGFRHSEDFRSVYLNGETFLLTSREAQLIEILNEAHVNGFPDVTETAILDRMGTGKRVRDIFASNRRAIFKKLVRSDKWGTHRLNL